MAASIALAQVFVNDADAAQPRQGVKFENPFGTPHRLLAAVQRVRLATVRETSNERKTGS